MAHDDAIVRPVVTEKTPKLGPLAAIVATRTDLRFCCRRLNIPEDRFRPLFQGGLYAESGGAGRATLCGPVLGAPYAVMVLETLVAWGAREIFFLGWCGAIAGDVAVGDILVPDGAIVDEGTSLHYGGSPGGTALPSARLAEKTTAVLKKMGVPFRRGRVWSTDGVFRETPDKVRRHRENGALAVEMEMSALFSAAAFRGVDLSGLLVASDELSAMTWRPGFKTDQFKNAREAAATVLCELCRRDE